VVVGEGRRVPDLRGALPDQGRVGILHRDQGDVRHRDQVTEIRGVVERMPVADLDGGDANGHGVLV
jgi:hypothetical protein